MKFLVIGLFALSAFVIAPASPGAMQADPTTFRRALVSARWWAFEDVPLDRSDRAWTRIRFEENGNLTRWHHGTLLTRSLHSHWKITGPGTVNVDEIVFEFDPKFTTFVTRAPDGSITKRGFREGDAGPFAPGSHDGCAADSGSPGAGSELSDSAFRR